MDFWSFITTRYHYRTFWTKGELSIGQRVNTHLPIRDGKVRSRTVIQWCGAGGGGEEEAKAYFYYFLIIFFFFFFFVDLVGSSVYLRHSILRPRSGKGVWYTVLHLYEIKYRYLISIYYIAFVCFFRIPHINNEVSEIG